MYGFFRRSLRGSLQISVKEITGGIRLEEGRILLGHGSGGALTHSLISGLFLRYFNSPNLRKLDDSAVLQSEKGSLVLTTDSFVVSPIFFPGGDIGRLAVTGTINDLVACGAKPRYLTVSWILEEGLPLRDLERIVASVAFTAQEAGIEIVAGDTKVVERGKADMAFITTAGVGWARSDGCHLDPAFIKPGDKVVVTGTVGEHGMAIMVARSGIDLDSPVISDCMPLNALIRHFPRFHGIRFMRDPSRGGLATALKEIASASRKDLWVREKDVPLKDEVIAASEILGLDPLYLASEGRMIIIVSAEESQELVEILRVTEEGKGATIIGEISDGSGNVYLETPLGGHRVLDLLPGEQLPRIC